jgi:hypothetical protein
MWKWKKFNWDIASDYFSPKQETFHGAITREKGTSSSATATRSYKVESKLFLFCLLWHV